MKTPSLRRALLLLAVTSLVLPEASASSVAVWGLHKQLSWTTSAGIYQGLYVVQIAPSSATFRLLCLCPGETRAVLTEATEAPRGVLSTVLLDDRSGWWVRLDREIGVHADDLQEFFSLSHEYGDESSSVPLSLTTSTGLRFETEVRAADTAALPDALIPRLLEAGMVKRLAADVPADFRAAILFLDRSLMDVTAVTEPGPVSERRPLDGLLSLLARAMFLDEREGASLPSIHKAPMSVVVTRKGLRIEDAELLSLVGSFTTVSPDNLFADPSSAGWRGTEEH